MPPRPPSGEDALWDRAEGALVAALFAEKGLRVDVDAREESVARRVAEAHERALPFVAVVGAREVAARSVALRSRGGQEELPLADAARVLGGRCASPWTLIHGAQGPG